MKKVIGALIVLGMCFGIWNPVHPSGSADTPAPATCGSPSCWGAG